MTERQVQIGEVAERTGLSINTIRHYDQTELVTPSARSAGGFRLYTERDVERLLLIRRMKPLGFSLEQVGELLAATDRLEQPEHLAKSERARLRELVAGYGEMARARRDQLEKELDWAREFITRMDELTAQ
jgi:DNA-binding transcriptional MerR regulator